MAYEIPTPAAGPAPSPVAELQRVLDPRLEWVHDKPIGPAQNQTLYNVLGVAWKVTAGQVTVRTARGLWQAGPGTWVLLQPSHRFQGFAEGTRIWSIGYRFNRVRGSSWYVGPDVLVLPDSPRLDLAGRRLLRTMERSTGQQPLGGRAIGAFSATLADWMRVDAAFRHWLAASIETVAGLGLRLLPSGHGDERIRQVLAAIARDPWSDDSGPQALAAGLRLSRRRLEQLFAAQIGHGLAEERVRRRLESASELLLRRDLQVKQVAARCHFPRSSAFSTWFRRHAGVTPMRFRRGGQTGWSHG